MIRRHFTTTIIHAAVLVAIFAAALSGCADSAVDRRLDQADAVMEQAPDSALAIIETIDTAAISSRATRARHALLLTQARVKTDVPVTSDSLISLAADYFADHGPDSLTMRAMFYKGVVLRDLNNIYDAINPATEAHDLAVGSDNDYWRAKAAELLADIYNRSYAVDESIVWCKEAATYYDKAGKKLNHLYSLYDLGVGYSNSKQIQKAIPLLDSIYDLACSMSDSALMACCQSDIFSTALNLNDRQKALQSWSKLSRFKNFYSPTVRERAWAAQMYNALDSLGAQKELTAQLPTCNQENSDLISVYESYSDYYKSVGDYRNAVTYMDSTIAAIDSTLIDVFRNSAIKAQRDYYNDKFKTEQQQSSYLETIIWLSITCFILLLTTAYVVYRNKLAAKNTALEQRMVEIILLNKQNLIYRHNNAELTENIKTNQHELVNLEKEIKIRDERIVSLEKHTKTSKESPSLDAELESLFKSQWDILNSLCIKYFQQKDHEAQRKVLLTNIKQEISKIGEPKHIAEIEQALNRYMSDIAKKLKNQCKFLDNDDFNLIILLFAGLTPNTISTITGIMPNTLYSKRRRLIERISKSGAPDRDLFISKMK